ncbi:MULTISPECIES: hypothetical protein [Paenibacillus]|uniref:hypothetical protein n=1 Tax=Paenibacillus TaxID=44249 RepID=UPI0022B920EE|nr:hypothetical protein [Paenibacillus caseinilyticus]MCZ8521827.1 hypothetical protein [Paenibacillus caseinilyticus]
MTDHPKGHVEFHPPAVRLAADLPGDEDMREHLEETMASDGYPGSCAVIGTQGLAQTEQESDQ